MKSNNVWFSLSNLLFLLDDARTKQFSHRNRLISSFHHSLTFWDYACACRHCCVLWDLTNLLSSWEISVCRAMREDFPWNLFIYYSAWVVIIINSYILNWIISIFHFFIKKFKKICLNLKFKLIKASKINVWGLSCRFILIFFFLCVIFEWNDTHKKIFYRFSSSTTTTMAPGVWELNV